MNSGEVEKSIVDLERGARRNWVEVWGLNIRS